MVKKTNPGNCPCKACQEVREIYQSGLDELKEFKESKVWRKTHQTFDGFCLDSRGFNPLCFTANDLLFASRIIPINRSVSAIDWDDAGLDSDEDF